MKKNTRRSDGAIVEPKPPFPAQHQRRPGIEARMKPRPRFRAPEYRAAGKLDGKVALITGGDSGIGRAVAYLFAREGADVAIVYLPAEERDAKETKELIEGEGHQCLCISGDVRKPAFCNRAVRKVVKEFGQLDVLVNNAAYQHHQKTLTAVNDEQLERTFRTNILGYMRMARAALPKMKRGAAIVNTGSVTGLEGEKELLDYSATKGAIHAFTKALAQNLNDRGIRVNCVAPGPVWTPLNVADKSARKAARHGSTPPMKRPAQPEELAPAYVFFASNADSSYISGEVLSLLGGETSAA
jgi:NAD(P)-dependent dehydrogenase (short-subunit alcohol dehydrogenase family)